ncbi:hypothetical protein FRB99_007743 [Tulasnella sp. 403]|nr:hypothetical protein FRB99_007743 [Tulasnella sp. 403]
MKALGPLESYRLKPSRIRVEKGEDYVSGGFGSVHRGTMNKGVFSSGTAVAVKKLRSAGDRSQRLRIAIALVREVKVWAGLRHRNILPLIGFYLNDSYDEAWLVCPWITNGSVAHYIARIRVSPEERLRLAIDTAEGLKHLHTRKPPICHGDIKAGNVLVADDGHAMLCDFGLARTTEAFSTGLTTANFDSAGSRRYQSPELILGEVSRRSLESDVWAWGCLLLEIFTGHSPYHTIANETSLVLRVSQNEVPASLLNEDMPAFVKDLLARCWQRQPEERPSMRQCLSALCQMPFSLDEAFTIRTDRNPTCHRFSRDGKYFAITFSKAICIYDTQTWEVLRELQAPMPPFCVRFSDNNRYLTAVAELFVMLYDLESGQLLPTMVESLNGAYDAEVASDGSFVAAVQKGDTPVHIWYPCDKEKGQPIPALAESTRVTISPDSKLLAAACAHGVRLWNVEEARQVASLNIGNVIDTYFSPNGDWLATDSTEVFYLEMLSHRSEYARSDVFAYFDDVPYIVQLASALYFVHLTFSLYVTLIYDGINTYGGAIEIRCTDA